jgi:hypothetical protein
MLNYNTFAFYQALRHSNPFLYYSSAIQKEMHDSYLVSEEIFILKQK